MARFGGDVLLSVFETAWIAAAATGQPLAAIGHYGLNAAAPTQKDKLPRAVVREDDSQRIGTTCQSVHWSVTLEIRVFDVGVVEVRTHKTAILGWIEDGLRDINALGWSWPSGVTPLMMEIQSDGASKPDQAVARGTIRLRFELSIVD